MRGLPSNETPSVGMREIRQGVYGVLLMAIFLLAVTVVAGIVLVSNIVQHWTNVIRKKLFA